jgi:alpha-mannosidase
MVRALFLLILAAVAAYSQQKRIYLAPDDHTDYMWTGNEEEYRQAFIEMIDYYLDLADKTRDNAPEHQSRWHCDGSIWLWTYERNKSPEEFKRLIDRVRDGHISVPLNALVSTYGGTPMEATLRGMYYAGTLERRFGLKIPMAIAMENQTLPYGLGSLWAGAGAKYSWKGICGCLTRLNKSLRRPHDMYWMTGPDDSRILMKWNTMHVADSGARTMGGYAEARTPAREIDFTDSSPAFQSTHPYPVIGIFGKGWDDLKTLTDEFVTVAKAKTTATRKVIVSNMNDFFVDFEKNHGQQLPNFAASFGNEWDLYSASITEVSARMRRSVEKLRAAEALATLVSQQRPGFMNNRRPARDQAWMNMGLYWEHNWTADGPKITRQERADWGRRVVAGVETYVDTLHADAAFALSGMIKTTSRNRRFYVFNPLGWQRSDFADVLWEERGEYHVVDLTTGRETPSQIVRLPGESRPFLRIAAAGLPPVGYKVYEIRKGKGQAFPAAAQFAGQVFENAIYKLKVEGRGAISSLVDKTRANREFGAKQMGATSLPGVEGVRGFINDLGLDPGVLEVENAGPVSVTLKARGESPLKHTTRITLFRDSRRIDIRNDIDENFDGTHAWNFTFNLKSPDVRHEEVGAIVRAKLLEDGGHYTKDFSRLEWLTLNHFVDMSGEDGAGVTLSNWDCAFMKLGNSEIHHGQSLLDTASPQIQVLAGGQIDAPQAGIPKQGGDTHFLQRFALQTHGGFNAASAMRFSLENQNPPVTGWLRAGGAYPETSFSLLTVSNPDVLLWALKPADDGAPRDLIARFWNLSPQPRDYVVSLSTGVQSARRVSHIETDMEPLPVAAGNVQAKANSSQIQTIRLIP